MLLALWPASVALLTMFYKDQHQAHVRIQQIGIHHLQHVKYVKTYSYYESLNLHFTAMYPENYVSASHM